MWEPVTDESSVEAPPQPQPQPQPQPAAALSAEEAARLRALLKPELRKLSRWLIAKRGWREEGHGLLLPPTGTGGSGLNAAGLYEYMRTRLPLFKEYWEDPEREAAASGGSSSTSKPKAKAAAAAAASAAPAKGNSSNGKAAKGRGAKAPAATPAATAKAAG